MSTRPQDFWSPVSIKPAPALAELHKMVFERSEKRSPKWKFRLAPNLVLQIQPKLTRRALLKFECRAIRCEGADLAVLLMKRQDIQRPYWFLDFDLYAAADTWTFQARRVSRNSDSSLRQDLIDAFQAGRFDVLRSDLMLGSHCLICGKSLVDPISQARHIGPECAGTSSAQLPFVLRLTEQAA
jgi:hypothetical protein